MCELLFNEVESGQDAQKFMEQIDTRNKELLEDLRMEQQEQM